MLEKEVVRFTRGGMQRVNLATGSREQLTDSGEHKFHPGREARFRADSALAEASRQLRPGSLRRGKFSPSSVVRLDAKSEYPVRLRDGSRQKDKVPAVSRSVLPKERQAAAAKQVRLRASEQGRLEAVRRLWKNNREIQTRAALRRRGKMIQERRKSAGSQAGFSLSGSSISSALLQARPGETSETSGTSFSGSYPDNSAITSSRSSYAGPLFKAASMAARNTVRSTQEQDENSAVSFLAAVQTNTTFLVSLLRRRKNNETKKQQEYKAAVRRQAAKKAARQAAQKAAQQTAVKETAKAAAHKAALSSPPVLILLVAAGLLALVVLLVTLTTALTSLFGGVGASLDDTALETYVTSLDTSFRNEIENKMGKDDERQGSYPNTNAYALALLATGDWVVDSLTAEIKAEMSRIYDLLNTYKTKDGEIRVDGEDGGMGYIKHIKIYVITRKAPEDILDELGYSGEERKRMEQRLEELYTLQEIFPSDGIAGGGGEIIDPDADWIGTGIFQWPLPENGTITSYFGNRVNPVTGKPDFHTGTDIAMPEGTPILAAADGTVEIANGTDSWGDSYGYYVKLDHGSGFETLYAHCSSICVTAGQEVSQGEVIGYVGTTGNSTGNHLHFEVRKNGQRVDALDYFTQEIS